MNFFEHQDRARRNTSRLVILLLLAVASLIAITTALFAAFIYYFQFRSDNHLKAYESNSDIFTIATEVLTWELLGSISLAVIAVVALGSLYKLMQLSGGGRTVAEAMGGRLLNLNTQDADEKKILNVVEEMAIASGTPVPPVYLIDEQSINAFAAGYKPQDAVIGITRGCIQLLSRDELQGVVAHEFSHILHGDMKLNIRLVGILHGILVIGLIGYFLLRSAGYGSYGYHRSRRSSNDKSTAAMFGLGAGLVAIGYAGTFFGNLIKAAVSRQREFLADASAVQFTRNPDGISGALQKIGGFSLGSQMQTPSAAEFSHMYFGQGVKTALSGLMATHPPLPERISRVDARWNGRFPSVKMPETSAPGGAQASAMDMNMDSELASNFSDSVQPQQSASITPTEAGATEARPLSAVESIGQPSQAHVDYAHNFIGGLPAIVHEAAHDPFSARALVYCLLFDSNPSIVEKQWQALRSKAHPAVFSWTEKLAIEVSVLTRRDYLPLLDLCLPALKQQSPTQYQVFKRNLILMIRADKKVDLFEWALYRIITHNIEDRDIKGGSSKNLKSQAPAVTALLSALAHAGHSDTNSARAAFNHAMNTLQLTNAALIAKSELPLQSLDGALDQLKQLKPLQKPVLLKAMAQCISHDGEVKPAEAELFRAIADSLDCPVPPLLPGQQLV